MNAYGYVRVSGKGQVEGDGEHRQLDAIKVFCKANSLSFAYHAFEAGVSGTVEGMDRPGFSELLESIPEGACIVVERMDRLARDLMVQEFLLKECRERGIAVYAADQGALVDMASDGGDPTRKLIRQVLGALAEWEKSALVLKLRKARQRIRAEKGFCEGARPYGETAEEQRIIELIRTLQAQGMGKKSVAKFLNTGGFTTRKGKPWDKWSVMTALLGPQRRRQKL